MKVTDINIFIDFNIDTFENNFAYFKNINHRKKEWIIMNINVNNYKGDNSINLILFDSSKIDKKLRRKIKLEHANRNS